ncbi:Mu transposase C-terminal domain-containing protein [Marinovum algicola]|uniref:Mu transposase C-terminal domain-containing protein n=1 Tax=Marinovum algicola TaxID=42444 RepID=UPI0024B93A7C|nr:DDE-type integrase/transposase/recombinase [Marinovum algicola]
MFDVVPSPQTPRYAFEPHDEIVVGGISYRPHASREWGYVFTRTDSTGVAESFDNGKLAHLVHKGLLRHNKGAFLPPEVRKSQLQNATILSSVGGRVADAMAFRCAFVEAFLELEAEGAVKRTDSSVLRAGLRIQRRAAEIRGLADRKSGQTGKDLLLPKMPHESTLLRWVRTYEGEGLAGLCDAKNRSGNRTRRIGLEELALIGPIVAGYADRSRPTQKTIYDRVECAFEEANRIREIEGLTPLVVPSRETVRKEIRRLDPYHTYIARFGQEAARKKFAPVGKGLEVTRPLERVEVDEWTIDLVSIFSQTGIFDHLTKEEKELLGLNKKKIRWTLTVAICAATRCILAMRLSRTPTKNSAVQALEMITQDKGIWADTFGAISPWNMWGVPELVVTDNGSAFISVAMRAAMQDLGIRAERCPTGFPQMRARIERLFGTMSSSLMPLLSGRTFSDVVTKGDAEPDGDAALTPEELSEALVRWVVDIYHNRPHEGLGGETPANCWNRLAETFGVRPAPDMRRRRLIFGTRTKRTVTPKGIRVFGVRYHSEALARWFVHAAQREVDVRWYREDIGAIEVNVDGEWLEVPSVFEEVRGVRAEVWNGAVCSLRASHREDAEICRPVVLQAIRDIEAMNDRAMKRQGLIVQDWSAENLQKMEDRLMIGFQIAGDEDTQVQVSGDAPRSGLGRSLLTEKSSDVLSGDEQTDAHTTHDAAPDQDDKGADVWINESK